MIKLYSTYNKFKQIFVKPKVHFHVYYGLYSGERFRFTTNQKFVYIPRFSTLIKTTTNGKDSYERSYHKLKSGKILYGIQWVSSIRKKLRKFGLGWFKPSFRIPKFLIFGIKNEDVEYANKWDYISFREPPYFEITLFGVSFRWSLHAPTHRDHDDNYWESLLTYQYLNLDAITDLNAIKELDSNLGTFTRYFKDHKETDYILNTEFLKEPYKIILTSSRKNV